MSAVEHFIGNGTTRNATLSGGEYATQVLVRTDDPRDTGDTVVKYLIANGFGYGSSFAAGNDENEDTRIYQIDEPELYVGSCDLWVTVVHYRTVTPAYGQGIGGAKADDPVDFRPKIETDTVLREVPVELATFLGAWEDHPTYDPSALEVDDESPIVNSALIEFVPQPTKQVSHRIIRISRNVSSVLLTENIFPEDWINDRAFTLSDRKTTIPIEKHKCKFLRWTTDPKFEEGIDFVEVGLELEVSKKGWDLIFLDQGTVAKAEAGDPDGRGGIWSASDFEPGMAQSRAVTDPYGNDMREPIPFDGSGKPLANYRDLVYGKWRIYDLKNPCDIAFLLGLCTEDEEE